MTLRILYDHQIFLAQMYGGISRYYYEIANRISEMGKDVEIIAPFYINVYFLEDCLVRPRGIKIPHFPIIARILLEGLNPVLSCLLAKPGRKVDIFHETYYSNFDCCPPSAKRVITVYDMIHEKFPGSLSHRVRKTKAHAVKRADHVICISENTRRDLIELLGIPEEKTTVVHLGHSLSVQKASVYPIDVGIPFILYVGSRGGYKNFEGLLRAYGHSQRLQNDFSLVCFGGGKFKSSELELMKSLNIPRSKIRYLSGADDVLAGLYASAAALICPSFYEGFGIPPLEAMSFGCPVACSNTSSLPEVVGDAAEFFDPAAEDQISSAIERIVYTPEITDLMINRGHERIKKFSWDKCSRETLMVYENIL
jgi:glycosyltransferase involved in cell wall biosynthesis